MTRVYIWSIIWYNYFIKMDPDDNPFWGEPTPTDLWDDMKNLNDLYGQLDWDHTDYLEFAIEGNHITIRNRSREGR